MKLETVKLFHCFPKQEDLSPPQQSYFLEFSLLNSNHWSNPSSTHAVHRIRTCKPFTANDFQDRSLATRTYGKYDSVVELPYLKLLLPLLCTISCGLSTAYGKVHPCRKLAQCVGLEPTRRINARPDSNRLQFQLWEHCRIFLYRQEHWERNGGCLICWSYVRRWI